MKKKLLLSILLALTLGACDNANSSEGSFNVSPTSTSYYDFDFYIENARYELESMCAYAWERIDDEELVEYIYQFYYQENEYLDSIEDIYEASQSIPNIKAHEAECIRTVFGAALNSRIDEYANPIIDSVNIAAAKQEVIEFVNDTKNHISNGGLGFIGTYNQYDMFMWEFEGKVTYIVWSHGGRWDPDNPGQEDDSPWQEQIDELWGYVDSLADEIQKYCDLDLTDYVLELVSYFDECATAQEANSLLFTLKDCVHEEALVQLKKSLCELYEKFVKYVDDSVGDYNVKKFVLENEEEVYSDINDSGDFESSIIEYENAVFHATESVIGNYKSLAKKLLEEMFDHYFNELQDDDTKILELVKTYSLYLERVYGISGDIKDLDDLVNEILDDFFNYGEELIRA